MKKPVAIWGAAVGVLLAAGVTVGLTLSKPETSSASSPAPAPAALAATTTTSSTTAAKLDAGDQFLKLLGKAAPPSRSGAVAMGRVMAKAVCPKIKYGDQMIVANLTAPLLNAGYGHQETEWIWDNPQTVTNALAGSFCDPRYGDS